MCAMPPPFMSILRRVVGFVLAVVLLNVRGWERYEDDEGDGDGDGGVLGAIGRTEASSSASRALAGDQVDSRARDDLADDPSSSYDCAILSSSFNEIVFRRESCLICLPANAGAGNGDEDTRLVARRGMGALRPFPRASSAVSWLSRRFALALPPSLRWSQSMIGLRGTFFCCCLGRTAAVGTRFGSCSLRTLDFKAGGSVPVREFEALVATATGGGAMRRTRTRTTRRLDFELVTTCYYLERERERETGNDGGGLCK